MPSDPPTLQWGTSSSVSARRRCPTTAPGPARCPRAHSLTGFASDAVLAGIVDKRTRVRADDPDREFPHGGILPVRRIRAAGASRMPDRRALRSPDSDVRGVVTMQPRLAEDLGVLALVQRDRRSGLSTPRQHEEPDDASRYVGIASPSDTDGRASLNRVPADSKCRECKCTYDGTPCIKPSWWRSSVEHQRSGA